jgi:hypothetical protein
MQLDGLHHRKNGGLGVNIVPKWRARRDSNYYTNVFTYREFFVKIWSEEQVEGQAEGVPLDLVGVLRQNPRATGKIGIRIPTPQPSWRNSNLKGLLGFRLMQKSSLITSMT